MDRQSDNTDRWNRYTKRFEALGTLNEIQIFQNSDILNLEMKGLLDRAADRVLEIDDRMSVFKPSSDIAALNRNAGLEPASLHPETLHVLSRSLTVSELSDGAFDCTIRPLVELWGIGKKLNFIPTQKEISQASKLINYRNLILNGEELSGFLKTKGQAVDLGGIAKGYAADEVRRILIHGGVTSALVNLGGNIHAIGSRPDCSPWQIGIQNPVAVTGEYLGILSVNNRTIVTSGSNERFFIKDGIRYHHLLDPRTGKPAQSGLLSVTVVSNNSTEADALTTSLFILGIEKGMELVKRFSVEAIFITEDYQVFVTEGLRNQFTIKESYP